MGARSPDEQEVNEKMVPPGIGRLGNPQEELYWAAGFWDGEGCASNDRGRAFSLYVNQVDPTALSRFQNAVGGIGTVRGPIIPRHKGSENQAPYWRWGAHGPDARRVAGLLLPLVCPVKREQFVQTSALADGATEGQLAVASFVASVGASTLLQRGLW